MQDIRFAHDQIIFTFRLISVPGICPYSTVSPTLTLIGSSFYRDQQRSPYHIEEVFLWQYRNDDAACGFIPAAAGFTITLSARGLILNFFGHLLAVFVFQFLEKGNKIRVNPGFR